MNYETVNLREDVYDILKKASDALSQNIEVTFEYVVRNALRVCGYIDVGGHIRLMDAKGTTVYLIPVSTTPPRNILSRIFQRNQQEPPRADDKSFNTSIADSLIADIKLQASIANRPPMKYINDLVFAGSALTLHFCADKQNIAFAYDSHNNGIARITFTPS